MTKSDIVCGQVNGAGGIPGATEGIVIFVLAGGCNAEIAGKAAAWWIF